MTVIHAYRCENKKTYTANPTIKLKVLTQMAAQRQPNTRMNF
jgi:hypothetical protein